MLVPRIFYHMATYSCVSDDSTFAWITNDSCFATVDKFGVKNLLFPMVYLIFDMLYMTYLDKTEVEGGGNLKKLMYAHHIIVVMGIVSSL